MDDRIALQDFYAHGMLPEAGSLQPPEGIRRPDLSVAQMDEAALAAIKNNPRYRALAIDTVLEAMGANGDYPEDFLP
jgi:hypothetical protein